MKLFITILLIISMTQPFNIFDFTKDTSAKEWQSVDDRVMGGVSNGQISISDEGHGIFEGTISLDNYGGFSSIRHRFEKINSNNYNKFNLQIKGDGKRYQFRVKASENDAHSYIFYFQTNGEWQNIEIPFSEMYASFRGRKLDYPNFPGTQMEEISFLIGNKKEEKFKLIIDRITLE